VTKTPDKADLRGPGDRIWRGSGGERMFLELVAAGVPLSQTLDALAAYVRGAGRCMLASILLVEDGARVRHAADPSLAEPGSARSDGQPIGRTGIVWHRRFLKQPVIVTDIATDPRWVNYRDAALAVGLRACWSVPIMGPPGRVLGTFACTTQTRAAHGATSGPGRPCVALATIAIQHTATRRRPREEARARLIVDNACSMPTSS